LLGKETVRLGGRQFGWHASSITKELKQECCPNWEIHRCG
jgi:predicted DNA-binding transcriptional regulator AlpA